MITVGSAVSVGPTFFSALKVVTPEQASGAASAGSIDCHTSSALILAARSSSRPESASQTFFDTSTIAITKAMATASSGSWKSSRIIRRAPA
jgi:hypothetical protein